MKGDLIKLLEEYAKRDDKYINPYFLVGLMELLDHYYTIEDNDLINDWINNMWRR